MKIIHIRDQVSLIHKFPLIDSKREFYYIVIIIMQEYIGFGKSDSCYLLIK